MCVYCMPAPGTIHQKTFPYDIYTHTHTHTHIHTHTGWYMYNTYSEEGTLYAYTITT